MIPIHQLLNRIRWDHEFAQADFRIGYYDRIDNAIIVVPFSQVFQEPGDHFSVHIVDDEGIWHRVPLHRIKQVYRDDDLIWNREESTTA
jgi:uncharacterized protein (UPF0248 family)